MKLAVRKRKIGNIPVLGAAAIDYLLSWLADE